MDTDTRGHSLAGLWMAAAATLPGMGAAVSVWTHQGQPGVAFASNLVASSVDELHFEFGEGPLTDAFADGRPVLVPDLAVATRWPVLVAAAVALGARALFAFPMQFGAIRMGTVLLHRVESGGLSAADLAIALRFCDAAAMLLVDAADQPGDARPEPDDFLDDGARRWVVHQASGMVMVQLGASIEQALARLRAYAFAEGRPLTDVATEVVARTLRLEKDTADNA